MSRFWLNHFAEDRNDSYALEAEHKYTVKQKAWVSLVTPTTQICDTPSSVTPMKAISKEVFTALSCYFTWQQVWSAKSHCRIHFTHRSEQLRSDKGAQVLTKPVRIPCRKQETHIFSLSSVLL